MKTKLCLIAAAALLAAGPALAQSGAEVLKAKGCLNCHDAQAKKVGPAFKEVAAKYASDKAAAANLVAKIRDGKGHMKPAATEAEIKAAVETVLATK